MQLHSYFYHNNEVVTISHKEIKKIITVGPASFGIILPRAWLRHYNLDDKDRIEIVSNRNDHNKTAGGN